MKSRQLEAILAEKSTKTLSQIDQAFRRLREARRLPRGARGVYAPSLTPRQAALGLVGAVASAFPSEASVAVALYSNCISAGDGARFYDALGAVLADPASGVRSVRLWVGSPFAEIVHADGSTEAFMRKGEGASAADRHFNEAMEVVVIGGGLLKRIAEGLADGE